MGEGSREPTPGKHRADGGGQGKQQQDWTASINNSKDGENDNNGNGNGNGKSNGQGGRERDRTRPGRGAAARDEQNDRGDDDAEGGGERAREGARGRLPRARRGRAVSVVRRPVRPGPGSLRLLAWVARLGVSGTEPARLVLGINQATIYSHIDRLVRAGWLWRSSVGDGRGPVVALTRAGAREARAHVDSGRVVSARSAAPYTARHGRAVSWVAANLQLRELEWLGPADLRAQPGWRTQRDDGARHSPDLGLVHPDGRRTAIEVELQPKSNHRLTAILGGYRALIRAGSLTDVSYVIERRDVGELVRRHARDALIAEHVQIGPLERLVEAARDRAGSRPHGARTARVGA